ncbi:MAG: type II secretion system protein [Gallionella sp.]|nr:MAG: type II secretion system protein [Gallionella sp.]
MSVDVPTADRIRVGGFVGGFTIVELLVTIVIVGILASAVFPMVELSRQRAKEQGLRSALKEIRTAIDAYKQAGDEGHIIRKPDESGYPHSLEELVEGVVDAKNPNGARQRFLRRIPQDPFMEPGDTPAKNWGKRSYISSHEDPREGRDIYDVYSRAPGVGLNGISYREW